MMLSEDFFSSRINRMYNDKGKIGSLSKRELYHKIKRFKADNKYATSKNDDKRLKSHIDEFDFVICLLEDYYDDLTKQQKGDYLQLGIILLIKSFIQDIIAIRRLTNVCLEIQVCNQARALMERELVIALCISDEGYCKDLIINANSKTDKQRFYTLTRPKSLLQRLKENKSPIFDLFYSETWEETYSLFSKFCHNDIYEWITYFDEGHKYNISLLNSHSKYFSYRLSYISQNILVFTMALMSCYSDTHNESINNILSLLLEYWQAIIDDSYK